MFQQVANHLRNGRPTTPLTHKRSAQVQHEELRVPPPLKLDDLLRLARHDEDDERHHSCTEEAVKIQQAVTPTPTHTQLSER